MLSLSRAVQKVACGGAYLERTELPKQIVPIVFDPVFRERLALKTDVRYWHLADIPPALTNVRYAG